ncbi:MAG: FtsX-like permease family protein, partial [Longimicrobiales bacterium]
MGVRQALGADAGALQRMVIGRALVLAGLGASAGSVMVLAAARFLRSLLFQVSPVDPPTLVASTLLLLGAAACAAWMPAHRAGNVDPAEALRME